MQSRLVTFRIGGGDARALRLLLFRPAALRGSLPAWSDRSTCPFGQDEMYGPRRQPHNGLIHELGRAAPDVVHESTDDVDGLGTTLWRTPPVGVAAAAPPRPSRCRDAPR